MIMSPPTAGDAEMGDRAGLGHPRSGGDRCRRIGRWVQARPWPVAAERQLQPCPKPGSWARPSSWGGWAGSSGRAAARTRERAGPCLSGSETGSRDFGLPL